LVEYLVYTENVNGSSPLSPFYLIKYDFIINVSFLLFFSFLRQVEFLRYFSGLTTNLVRFQKYLFAGGAVRPSPGTVSRGSLAHESERAGYTFDKI
jgi:hypothetical protein